MKKYYQSLLLFGITSLLILSSRPSISNTPIISSIPDSSIVEDNNTSTTNSSINNYTSSSEIGDIENNSSSENSFFTSNEISSTNSSIPTYNGNKVKVYLNPSVQVNNLYVNNLGTEAGNMNDICEYMVEELKDVEFISLKYNLRYLSLSNSIKESNEFNADIHFALHSNAGGGQGSEIYTSNDTHFATCIYEKYTSKIGNFKKRGVKINNSFYEIKNSKAKNRALIELLFHDNAYEAKFIVDNKQKIAKILSDAIIDYVQEFYFNIY